MELATKYSPEAVENRWYEYWMQHKLFHSTPDHRPAYTVVIPPPNVTGVLHMGHMLNNSIQDILVHVSVASTPAGYLVPTTPLSLPKRRSSAVWLLRASRSTT